ncbi:FAD-dependent monooxygenase [Methylobacterium brachythecii]|uniref:2-octaprenyl-6-methoxyphenol hydroxylase n=1 Tax=Methylobacterium brachythecii TaxID=1176177 RepID=A0A7W6AKL2_9HYPH|nr:FAD-dependent monooxygenase [Methylobacterium brachythecii]MBB3902894.1 2-octaprenyl-6-methoxyphenol hydroxylase [Methylobacterium brachythecii]GLS43821.1 2-octaprenyl-6-methoxyphenyl hydroxylase [Methylobacterium brachythecii]
MSGETGFEVAVVGAGAAGLSAALALAREGIATALIGRHAPVADGRTVALLDGSVRFLDALGAWAAIAPQAAPLIELHLVDDTGSLFRPPPARFVASEIGLDAFGWNVESARLVESLRALARATPNLTVFESDATANLRDEDGARITLEDDRTVEARLIVGADGGRSPLRASSGLAVRDWSYPQAAVTTILAHYRPHRDVSTEFHTRSGPFTLVPLPGGHRSSLVWVMGEGPARRLSALDDAALASSIERQAQAMLGAMRIDGPRGLVPMRGLSVSTPVAERLALISEAAHVFPPIGAQGLNLGLRDAAGLRDAVIAARQAGRDPGSRAALSGFARGRAVDARLRGTAVDWLNRSLLADLLPVDALRGLGLLAMSTIGPLRRAVMREGVLPRLGAPELMRGR